MKFGFKSDRGIIRELNEDSYTIISGYAGIPDTFIVADGMGGHNSGEVASKMAVQYIMDYILQHPDVLIEGNDICSSIREIMEKANAEVYARSREDESTFGMGTTLILAVVSNRNLFIGHVGDSRLYLIREHKIERITIDHSFIEELVRNGSLTREEAEHHPKKNLITRALGCDAEIQVDTYSCGVHEGDIFLICTDGLTNMLDEEEIKSIIEKNGDPQHSCDELVNKANEKGGEDNVTVIVIRTE